jgi:hypothetical protein
VNDNASLKANMQVIIVKAILIFMSLNLSVYTINKTRFICDYGRSLSTTQLEMVFGLAIIAAYD